MHYRMVHSVPGLHPLDASSPPPAGTCKSVSRYCKYSWGSKSPLVENHYSKGILETSYKLCYVVEVSGVGEKTTLELMTPP